MPGMFTCHHCGKVFPRNHRLKKTQRFCSAKSCQQARRSARKKARYKDDPAYRRKHLARQKIWREQSPAHEYQKQYRVEHPDYTDRNREQQGERNKKRQKDGRSMIVNGTSLSLQANDDKAYAVFKVKNKKIVNGTSFIAEIQLLTMKEAILAQRSV